MLTIENIEKSFDIEADFNDPELWKILALLVYKLDGLEDALYAIVNLDLSMLKETLETWYKEQYSGNVTDWAYKYLEIVKESVEDDINSDTDFKITMHDKKLIHSWIENIKSLIDEAKITLSVNNVEL